MINREIILGQRRSWYQRVYIGLELVKVLKNKELAFITDKTDKDIGRLNVRYLLATKYDLFKMHIEELNFLDKNINLYRSLASFKDKALSVFSYNLKNRLQQTEYKEFNDNYDAYVENYDMVLDIDGKGYPNREIFYRDAKELKKVLDDFQLPYGVWNSSFNGLHFFIDGKWFKKEKGDDWFGKRLDLFHEISYNLKGIYAIGDDKCGLDCSIWDNKRVAKLPYSYVGDGSICLPLTDEQFHQFFKNQETVTMSNVLKDVQIKERGLLIRNLELDEETLKENVNNFVKEFK